MRVDLVRVDLVLVDLVRLMRLVHLEALTCDPVHLQVVRERLGRLVSRAEVDSHPLAPDALPPVFPGHGREYSTTGAP
ncbi:MAG: hypothetical protein NXI07_11935, partial [bacterium]|nr:hypothetical protein [bacterium]